MIVKVVSILFFITFFVSPFSRASITDGGSYYACDCVHDSWYEISKVFVYKVDAQNGTSNQVREAKYSFNPRIQAPVYKNIAACREQMGSWQSARFSANSCFELFL